MKDERITYETAKLAKDKGFSVSTGDTYEQVYDSSSGKLARASHLNYHSIVLAPTQSLLQRWLREECNIQVYVYSSTANMNGKPVDWIYEGSVRLDRRDGLDSYEEALEKGLQEALKLIE